MKSKITGGKTQLIFTAKVLNKYDVKYFRCEDTGFIQTEEPFWLPEAYSSAITKLDLGLPYRNELLRSVVVSLINKCFNLDGRFLDYAGGYGLFTRLMRDQGFDYYHNDKYCENIFAEYFESKNIYGTEKFELVTAFEVFEHMSNPIEEIKEITKLGDSIFFTTELQPKQVLQSITDWWYFIPETGQHIALHTELSLQHLAKQFGYNFYTDGLTQHLFTKKSLQINPFKVERDPFLIRKMRKLVRQFDAKNVPQRESLLLSDWSLVKSKLS